MSEPVQTEKLDLAALGQALDEGEAKPEASKDSVQGTTVAADIKPEESNTLSQPASDQPSTKDAKPATGSPATLSPNSARSISPVSKHQNTLPTALAPAPAQPTQGPPSIAPATPVQQLKTMFPDLDEETIATVLQTRGGDQEAAVNALLQMSDPSYKPSNTENQTDNDAVLAQTLALEEERQQQHLLSQQQGSYFPQQSGGRGGGGAGAFLSSFLGSGTNQPPRSATYDPNALTYQPRVRRPPPSPGARAAYAAPPPPGHDPNQAVIPKMPGPNEAKQWQEEINKMAETGFAKAASTFSSLRQKANAAFATTPPGENSPSQAPTDGANQAGNNSSGFWRGGRGGGGASTYLQGISSAFGPQRQNTAPASSAPGNSSAARGLASPRSPHMGEYDRDPSPVGDNELAKILARGSRSKGLAERYGSNQSQEGRASASSATGSEVEKESLGWESAGRTPIKISNNTKDSVAMMDASQGRGLTSPKPRVAGSSTSTEPTSKAPAATSTNKDDGSDSDDLEYVSNPFEDED